MNIPNDIMNINTPPQFDMQYTNTQPTDMQPTDMKLNNEQINNLFNLLNRMNERINELIEKYRKNGIGILLKKIKEEFRYLDDEFIVNKISNFFNEKSKKDLNKEFDGGKSKKKLNKKSKKKLNKKSKKRTNKKSKKRSKKK